MTLSDQETRLECLRLAASMMAESEGVAEVVAAADQLYAFICNDHKPQQGPVVGTTMTW